MADDNNILDTFLTPEKGSSGDKSTNTQNNTEINLEDEFTKLLRDFIGQDANETGEKEADSSDSQQGLDEFETENNTETKEQQNGLDGFVTGNEEPQNGLEGFVTQDEEPQSDLEGFVTENTEQSSGLEGFVTENTEQSGGLDGLVTSGQETASSELDGMVSETPENKGVGANGLKQEEQELARAISNFQDGVTAMASNKNLKMPKTDYTESMLKPNYKPSVGKKIAQYLLDCWDIINRYDPENMKRLSPTATDEEYLAFAESVSDVYLQLSIISYVEILINIEICEVNYEQQKQLALKNRIKRELYEEYMELQERKNKFIQKLKEKKFPIDADKLINNYFRAAQKDADGAFEALTKNPAMFSRIEIEKMRPKFFGLIKVTPEDGIKMNQKIGKFIKNLKV